MCMMKSHDRTHSLCAVQLFAFYELEPYWSRSADGEGAEESSAGCVNAKSSHELAASAPER